MKKQFNQREISLAEILVAVFVLSIGILSMLMFFSNALQATEYARDLTVATSHGENVHEEMVTQLTLANITATDWDDWRIAEGYDTLPFEQVSVAYVNALSDPLDITTTVSWIRHERQNNVVLRTQMTK